jgi:hypothetical protein
MSKLDALLMEVADRVAKCQIAAASMRKTHV